MINGVGQLIMTGIGGTILSDEEKKFIKEENIGGVLLFSKNFDSIAQLGELVNSIQTLNPENPLFIAVDHEGGRVIRFKKIFTQFPAMLEISKLKSPKLFYEIGSIMAQELSLCGINVNLAPCCDILTNKNNKVIGDRAFGKTAKKVEENISGLIRGLQTNHIIACAKHFPGHGNTLKDSHKDLPIVKTEMETLEKRELLPFKKAIKSKVAMVMMGHLLVDSIDEQFPTSLSPKAHKLLRETLKFSNIIISDDMQMEAITKSYGVGEAAMMALDAGTDIIEYRDMEMSKRALNYVKKIIEKDPKRLAQLKQKLERIKRVKKEFIPDLKPISIIDISSQMNNEENQTFLSELHEKLSHA